MKNKDLHEWLLDEGIDSLTTIVNIKGESIFIVDVLEKHLKEQLLQPDVSGSLLEQIRKTFADYYASEGCSCCENIEPHKEANLRLGKLLNAEMYDDNSGVDWYKYRSKQ